MHSMENTIHLELTECHLCITYRHKDWTIVPIHTGHEISLSTCRHLHQDVMVRQCSQVSYNALLPSPVKISYPKFTVTGD